jgi:hypothetical protein
MKAFAICLLTAILFVAAPSATLAKVPWSSVEIEPDAPVAGEQFTVAVQFFADPRHARPVHGMPDRITLEFHGPGRDVPVTLDRIGDGAYRAAEITLSEASWRLVAAYDFGEVSGQNGVEIATVTVAAAPASAGPVSAAVIGITLVSAGALWRWRRSTGSK